MTQNLLLFAHPSQRRSEVNRPMFDRARRSPAATLMPNIRT